MSDDIRVGRPDGRGDSLGGGMPSRMGSGNGNNMPWIVLAVVVLVIIIAAILFRDKLFPGKDDGTATQTEEQQLSGYQAVFLTNGQVYFGKLSDVSATYATLNDIYYLQVTQPPVQQASQGTGGQPATAQTQAQAQAQAQLSLVKLGNELHGPVDEMKINRDQILFYEDIKEDGRVMTAIREYQKNPPAQNTQQAPATQAPATQAPATQAPATPTK